ncbi:MAG: hypothetical protein QW255_04640 [Candidatus Bilamarchaeaceae archaeon]
MLKKQYFNIKVPNKIQKSERDVMREIKAHLHELGFFVVRIEGAGKLTTDCYGRKQLICSASSGLPDYLVLGYNTVFAIEVKSPARNAKLSYKQAKMLSEFISRNLHAAIVFSTEGVDHFLTHTLPDYVIVFDDIEIPVYF